jgi:hypothetical protein
MRTSQVDAVVEAVLAGAVDVLVDPALPLGGLILDWSRLSRSEMSFKS